MKNKSKIRLRLISSIKVILAVGAMIAICTFISHASDKDVYATPTASPIDNWEIIGTPVITYSDGTTPYKSGVTLSGFNGKFTYGESESRNLEYNNGLHGQFSPSFNQVNGQHCVLYINEFKLSDDLTGDYQNSQNGINGSIDGSKVTFSLQGVTIVTHFPTKPSEYYKIEKGDYDEDDDHKSLGITGSLSKKKVGEILDYVYEHNSNLRSKIDNIMKSKHKLSLALSISKLESSDVDDDEKDAMKKKARDYDDADDAKIANYFDISLYITDDNEFEDDFKITEPGKSISFTYEIPNSVKNKSSSSNQKKRYFNVVRYHGDKAHGVGLDYDTDTTLEFSVNEFSTFGTAYYDKSSSSSSSKSSSSSSSRTGSSSIASARTPTTGGTSSGNAAGGSRTGSGAPKTGDEFNAKLWIYFLVVGVVVALCAFILYQDTKDWRDEKKEAK